MIIMASTLIQAINECRHITLDELTKDNIKNANTEKQEKQEEKKEG